MKQEHIVKSYFKIAENWYGKGMVIKVKFIRGANTEEVFCYDHDYVYDKTIDIYREKQCWIDHSCYSSSTNIPRDVLPFLNL